MGSSCETVNESEVARNGFHMVRHAPFQLCSNATPSWFDLRVFYIRVSNFAVDDSTPELLTLNHIPLNPDTLLEVNGVRCSIYADGISSQLRRDRVDKKSEEATFVSTDSIKFTGSVKFEVFNKEDLVLTGVLEMHMEDSKDNVKRWSLTCESEMVPGTGLLKGKINGKPDFMTSTVEVYVAGCCSGAPIILTKALQLSRKKQNRKGVLDAIPENDASESRKDSESQDGGHSALKSQVTEYRNFKLDGDDDINSVYWGRPDYLEGEDGELSWFNAGVRVGVGIGLGVCLGVGIGVGLLVRTYHATTRNFRRRLL